MHPNVFINDKLYKVFWSTFAVAPNCSRTNAFLTFCKVVNRLRLLVKTYRFFDDSQSRKTHSAFTENLMLLDTFRGHFAKRTPKVSINDRFYKVFRIAFPEAPKRCVANAFLIFCEIVKRLQLLLKSLMLFDTFWSRIAKMTSKVSINDRFYKVFWSTSFDASKRSRTNAFLMVCKVGKRLQLLLKSLMLFWWFQWSFAKMAPRSTNIRQGL